jgi:hypothetical protein
LNQPHQFAVVEVQMSPWEAHITRALLESEGLPAFLASEHHVWASWPWSLVLGGVRVLVPVGHLQAAKGVLALRDAGELQAALLAQHPFGQPACLRCGSTKLVSTRSWLSVSVATLLLFVCRAIFPPTKEPKCASCGSLTIGEA